MGKATDPRNLPLPREGSISLETLAQAFGVAFSSQEDAVFVIGASPRTIVACNHAAERMFGYAISEMIGHTSEFLHVDEASFREFARRSHPRLEAEGSFHGPYRMKRRDGSVFDTLHTVTLLKREHGLAGGAVSIVKDRSDVARLAATVEEQRERLLRVQRLETLGRLAAGMVHDAASHAVVLRNLVNRMSELELPGQASAHLNDMQAAANHLLTTIREVMALGRPRDGEDAQAVPIDAAVHRHEALIRTCAGPGIRIRYALEAGEAAVLITDAELIQVLLNLVTNSADAMQGNGEVTIGTERREGTVQLSVRDRGVGMDAAAVKRAAEPFYTTKDVQRGSGLGLTAVRDIAMRRDGTFEVDSVPDRGTTIRVILPIAER